MRLRKVKNAGLIIKNNPDIVIANPENYYGKWHTLFNNNNSIYLEIGMGKGKFLIEHALKNPDINYIGIEKFDSVIIRAVEKLSDLRLPNIVLLNEEALNINQYFKHGEISYLYLNFSDPWPKSRHEKRRLTNPLFLKSYENILSKDALLEFKTDNQKLFEYSIKEMNNYPMFFEDLKFDLHDGSNEDIITTEYEEKFKKRQQNIYYVKARF